MHWAILSARLVTVILLKVTSCTTKPCFCPPRGIFTHHQHRSNPLEDGGQPACRQGISPLDFAAVRV